MQAGRSALWEVTLAAQCAAPHGAADRHHGLTSTSTGAHSLVVLRPWDYASRQPSSWAARVGAQTRLLTAPVVGEPDSGLRARGSGVNGSQAVGARRHPGCSGCPLFRGADSYLSPSSGNGGETLRFQARKGIEGESALGRMLVDEPMMLQPNLPSVERDGARSANVIDGEVTHAVVKRAVEGDYRVQDDHGGTDAPVALEPAERALVEQAMAAVDEPLLYCRVDMLRGPDGNPLLIEMEAVEPSLFFRHGRSAAVRLAEAIVRRADGCLRRHGAGYGVACDGFCASHVRATNPSGKSLRWSGRSRLAEERSPRAGGLGDDQHLCEGLLGYRHRHVPVDHLVAEAMPGVRRRAQLHWLRQGVVFQDDPCFEDGVGRGVTRTTSMCQAVHLPGRDRRMVALRRQDPRSERVARCAASRRCRGRGPVP